MLAAARKVGAARGLSAEQIIFRDRLLAESVVARVAALAIGARFGGPHDFRVDGPWQAPRLDAGLSVGPVVPVVLADGRTGIAVAATPALLAAFNQGAAFRGDHAVPLIITTRAALHLAIRRACGDQIAFNAAHSLALRQPEKSAGPGTPVTGTARFILSAGATAFLLAPGLSATALFAFLSLFFVFHNALRLIAALTALRPDEDLVSTGPLLSDRDLPVYTVLIPLYREAGMLKTVRHMVESFDYPADKLDVKLLLEADDIETVTAAHLLHFPASVEIHLLPDTGPRTKPKALNAALATARGSLVTVFDAEDRPQAHQLRQAATAFARLPPSVAVLQARLHFYNRFENWLARQFAIEYAAHFDLLLPALVRLGLPLPLGGTSNHLRINALRQVGGWDAYNVTEDADLGIRLARCGYKARVLNAATEEEAACQPGNWLRQRTRWMKGWMQTAVVHMRRPGALRQDLGAWPAFGVLIMIGGLILAPVAHAAFAAALAFQLSTGSFLAAMDGGLHQLLFAFNALNLFLGSGAAMALGYIAVRDRGWNRLLRAVPAMPLYWLLIAAAAFRALGQILCGKMGWEKTEHGLSRVRRNMREPL